MDTMKSLLLKARASDQNLCESINIQIVHGAQTHSADHQKDQGREEQEEQKWGSHHGALTFSLL